LPLVTIGQADNYLTKEQALDILTGFLGDIKRIEGIWRVSGAVTAYDRRGRAFQTEQFTPIDWAIIRQEAGLFVAYPVDATQKITHRFYGTGTYGSYQVSAEDHVKGARYVGQFLLESSDLFDFAYHLVDVNIPAGYQIVSHFSLVKIFPKKEDFERLLPVSGTGFAILSGGYIATCQHVLDEGRNITVSLDLEGERFDIEASLVKEDPKSDVAIIRVNQNRWKNLAAIPFEIRKTRVEVGETVFILGYPLPSSMGSELKLTTGVLSSTSGFQGDPTCYQVSAPAQPGNSGGPAFDSQGRLIGLVSAKHSGAENVTYVVKVDYLLRLISDLSPTFQSKPASPLKGKPLQDQVRILRDYVFMLTVRK